VVLVGSVRERDQEAGVGNALHGRENPLRDDSVRDPLIDPARRMNG
jgi:hypothetical protein